MEKIDCETGILEDVLVNTKIASSKREAREWIKGNSIAINGIKQTDAQMMIDAAQAYIDSYVIIRRGKKNYYCINIK